MWGFETWDANGNKNNSGVIPFLLAGIIDVPAKVKSFSYTYVLPEGYEIDYTILDTEINSLTWRNAPTYNISINKGTISALQTQSPFGIPSDQPKTILVFYKKVR